MTNHIETSAQLIAIAIPYLWQPQMFLYCQFYSPLRSLSFLLCIGLAMSRLGSKKEEKGPGTIKDKEKIIAIKSSLDESNAGVSVSNCTGIYIFILAQFWRLGLQGKRGKRENKIGKRKEKIYFSQFFFFTFLSPPWFSFLSFLVL